MTDPPIRVAIVDDDAIVRSALTTYLGSAAGFEIVHTCANGAELLDALAVEGVDVVIMDLRMPVLDGLTATSRVRALFPRTRVLLLTSFDEDEALRQTLAAGASGFLLKDTSPQGVVDAVRSVRQGTSVVSPAPLGRLLRSAEAAQPPRTTAARPGGADLSPREAQILGLLCAAYSNAEISAELGLSDSTVKSHVSTIMMKLGVTSRLKAVVRAYELGLATPDEPPRGEPREGTKGT